MVPEIVYDPDETYLIYTYSRSPLILYAMLNPFAKTPITSFLARSYGKSCTLLCNTMNSIEHISEHNAVWFDRLRSSIKEFLTANENNRMLFLGNTLQECAIMKQMGVDSLFVNHNSFLNYNKITVRKSEKRFNAIYVAQISDFKRHYLAAQIDRLALIYGVWGDRESKLRALQDTLPNAMFANGFLGPNVAKENLYRFLSRDEVNNYVSSASVGLCLSAVEGAMYSSFEYLLAGIPVVSTANDGGRDIMFPPEFAKTVEASATKVATAVRQFAVCEIDPNEVRSASIRISDSHRHRLLDAISLICRRVGASEQQALERHTFQLSETWDGTEKYRAADTLKILD